MSVHYIYKGAGGAKFMRPVPNREEYLKLRNGGFQRENVARIRQGDEAVKSSLVQMNYSCLPNDDGSLKGSKRMSTTVGMDIDHLTAEEMPMVRERILSKKDELGLRMLEESARGAGYHLVFQRRADLDQVGNLKWASELLNVAYDAQAKDITRVFFTTTEQELIYLDDSLFTIEEFKGTDSTAFLEKDTAVGTKEESSVSQREPCNPCQKEYPKDYNGIPYADLIRKYWELFNDGKEPSEGDRNVLTFELAATIRSIRGYSLEQLMQVVPNYWAKPDGTCSQEDLAEWRKTLENALKEPRKGMPYRLKQVLQALKSQQAVKQGKSGSGDGTLRSWQSRGYIVYDEVSGRYVKTESYKQKFSSN